MKDHRGEFDVEIMCSVLQVSRSGFYDWLKRDHTTKDKMIYDLKRKIEDVFLGSRKTYGSPRVFQILKGMGQATSKETVARLMKEMGLFAKTKRKFRVSTTDSKHSHPVSENLVDQNFQASKPNEIWLSDLTYIPTAEGWLYLVSVMDLCTRKIIGWDLSTSLKAEQTINALKMAVSNQKPGYGVIFHSDRGVQYACHEFRAELQKNGFKQSMSRKGNCYDNAPMESFFHTLKTEFVHHEHFTWIESAKLEIFEWIEGFYNRKRIHSSIGYKTPLEMEEKFMHLAA